MDENHGRLNSRIEHFRNLSPAERLNILSDIANLPDSDRDALSGSDVLPSEIANGMIENTVGKFELPLGVATNFKINGRDYLIPMAVEEPSVVAAASFMAKIIRENGGFRASSSSPVMRAQIQVLGIADLEEAENFVLQARQEIVDLANSRDKFLVSLGGGCQDIEVHKFADTPVGSMLIVHLLVDVRDAMGANAVNTMAEAVAPTIERLTGGTVKLRILSNLADRRTATAKVTIAPQTLESGSNNGSDVAQGIVEACAFAMVDPYRAATNNKGIMNGIDPVVLATGNDWRAIEAGAHAWAARSGHYTSLSHWELDSDGNLTGHLKLPMALGLVGGATKTHPAARASLKLLGVSSATELAEVVTCVGLAQNMAALRALSTEGIQRGHMALHARNVAIAAGAKGDDIDRIANALAESGEVTADKANALLRR